jgi:hypothetical protein
MFRLADILRVIVPSKLKNFHGVWSSRNSMLKPTHRNMLIVGMILFIVFSAVSLTISEAKPPTIDNASPFTGYEKPTGNNFINPGGSANNGLQYNGDFSVKPKPLPIVPLVNPVVDDKNKNHNQGSGNNNQIPDDHNQGSGNNNQIPDDHFEPGRIAVTQRVSGCYCASARTGDSGGHAKNGQRRRRSRRRLTSRSVKRQPQG